VDIAGLAVDIGGLAVDIEDRLPVEAADCQPDQRRLAGRLDRKAVDPPVDPAAGTCAIHQKEEQGAPIDPAAAHSRPEQRLAECLLAKEAKQKRRSVYIEVLFS
jgi:hypothetical protein